MLAKWSSSTNDVSKMIPSNLLSMHWIVVMVRFVYGFVFHNLHPSMVWTMGLWFTSFIRPWLRRMFLRLNLVLSFRRVYLGVYFSFWGKLMDDTSLRPRNLSVHAFLPLVDHSGWMHIKWRIPRQLCIYLKIHHIYIYIYIWKSKLMQIIRPESWHMLES